VPAAARPAAARSSLHITYGAIVTGREARLSTPHGPLLLGQGALRHTGVDPERLPAHRPRLALGARALHPAAAAATC
jgi:hypothetical protein